MHLPAGPIELHAVQRPDAARIQQAAREFEGLFAQILIKSMRDASFGDSLFPGENQLYRDMYDQQLARSMTDGPGLGLAQVIARQLGASEPGPALDTRLPAAVTAPGHIRMTTPGPVPVAGAAAPVQTEAPSPAQSPMDRFIDRLMARARPAAQAASRAVEEVAARAPAAIDSAVQFASNLDPRSPEGFVAKVWPHAQRAARELGVDPRALVAQAALETGWGRRMIQRGDGGSANNLFGIKATGWNGERASANTHEYRDGVRRNERADFRAYASPAESFADYVRLLKRSPRYAQALQAGSDVRGFAQALQRAGYATDPSYADKITAIANGPTLRKALGRISQLAQDAGQVADAPRRAAVQVARSLETLLPAGGSR